MPRVADHAQRRRQVVEAAIEVLAGKGMDGFKVAEVASAAGVSVGLVQRYFRSKDDMLLTTCEFVAARLAERVARATEEGVSVRDKLRRSLAEFLPLDEERAAEVRVYLAFYGRAADSRAVRSVQAVSGRTLRSELRGALADAQEAGELAAGLDLAAEAAMLWALLDGLVLQSFVDPAGLPAGRALELLDAHLDRLFG
ncbi:TetR/AcrR family transcriptional regulator [Kibdelosporangium phytohabitans]|uniref:HTH tetR-type domain-containing protein n=1 Tax=Kibdelosporangium phytohabitans TaxID=860235 RepID=A0A0N9IF15_9PSEU|nr:TetR/AcrR family transcriptional regulator [Kibdelosporangium phytohabitans]ALG15066.1 hypothetical protein AOZ06_25840 [Kibdelosporangium phytohabitans]MBE1468742.1 AcrR family transcriptional regulator [Kibdelosporangium phytohabitans]